MEEITEVALAYYNNFTEDLRDKIWEFFRSMDTDGDGRISRKEFNEFLLQTGYDRIITGLELFSKLDRNGDRGLDFWEVLTFYYIIKTSFIHCQGCRKCLSGNYFTCFDCFEEANLPTFDLCDACHGSSRIPHPHTNFCHSHILLYYKRGPDNNMAMDDLPREAVANYNCATQDVRRSSESFFQSMAHGASQISSAVFHDFLCKQGYNWIINDPNLFQKLDRNRDGSLDFWEMLTFHYIIRTRYFHCRRCQVYLGGSMYFTCVACFDGGADHHRFDPGTYNLCATCYRSRDFVYQHPHTYFLDNNILLRSKRGRPPYAAPHLVTVPSPRPLAVCNNNYNVCNNNYNVNNYYYYYYCNHQDQALQPVPPSNRWLSALKALEVTLVEALGLAAGAATIAVSCSIM